MNPLQRLKRIGKDRKISSCDFCGIEKVVIMMKGVWVCEDCFFEGPRH